MLGILINTDEICYIIKKVEKKHKSNVILLIDVLDRLVKAELYDLESDESISNHPEYMSKEKIQENLTDMFIGLMETIKKNTMSDYCKYRFFKLVDDLIDQSDDILKDFSESLIKYGYVPRE